MDVTKQQDIEVSNKSSPPEVVSGPQDAPVSNSTNKQPDQKKVFDPQSFTRVDKILESTAFVSSTQEIFDSVCNGVRVPKLTKDGFVPYSMAFSKNNVPVIAKNYLYRNYGTGAYQANGTPTNFNSWTFGWEASDGYLVPSEEDLCILWDSYAAQGFLTKAAVYAQGQIDQGVRNARAIARYILGDFQAFLTGEIDTLHRRIRTDSFAEWMYKDVVNPSGNVYIVNAQDLIDYLNTHLNTYPVPQRSLCLNLPAGASDADLGKLALFSSPVIVDYNSSVTTNAVYNNIACRQVPKQTVYHNDFWISGVLERSYSPEEASFAILYSSFHFVDWKMSSGDVLVEIKTFTNTIQDQVLNFFYGGGKANTLYMPHSLAELRPFIWSHRMAKTMLVQKACMMDDYYGTLQSYQTSGFTLTDQNFDDDISGIMTINQQANHMCKPINVPFEFYIQNGAHDLVLDEDDLVSGEPNVDVNKNFKVPRSQVTVSLAQYNGTPQNISVDYYIPNEVNSVVTATSSSDYNVCVFQTLPRYSSDTLTMSISYINNNTIIYRHTKAGRNRNRVHRRDLGF